MKQSFWAIAAAACFSIMGAFVKFCTEDMGAFELVFYRSLFGAVFIAFVVSVVLVRKELKRQAALPE